MSIPRLNVVSISGGKDSTATALVCLALEPRDSIRLVFADTGHEHPITYEYIDYLEGALGLPIDRVKANFTDRFARRRQFIIEQWPMQGVPQAVIDRALGALVLSGNPFLDLCLWKGRFPSRRAQFCTQHLKREPLEAYQLDLVSPGRALWSWQGIRADESLTRRHLPSHALHDPLFNIWVERPILRWPASATFEAMAFAGIEPNPLYRLGMGRVGCMPCINATKAEVTEINRRFPEVIERVEEMEWCVNQASKRGAASFFAAADDGRGERQGRNIRAVVEWAKTSRGGVQFDLMKSGPAAACASEYGLCE